MSCNGIQLHKDHAIVHTATIDVKIIRLNKRQLTQSVFRQLDEESIFLSDGTLRGVPWGRVNYTWKENKDGTAFNVIWQHGEYLKRSPVPDPLSLKGAPYEWVHDPGSIRLHDLTIEELGTLYSAENVCNECLEWNRGGRLWTVVPAGMDHGVVTREFAELLLECGFAEDNTCVGDGYVKIKERYVKSCLHFCSSIVDTESVETDEMQRTISTAVDRLTALASEMCQLDQLFIAT